MKPLAVLRLYRSLVIQYMPLILEALLNLSRLIKAVSELKEG